LVNKGYVNLPHGGKLAGGRNLERKSAWDGKQKCDKSRNGAGFVRNGQTRYKVIETPDGRQTCSVSIQVPDGAGPK